MRRWNVAPLQEGSSPSGHPNNNMKKESILKAAGAKGIPVGQSGLWYIHKKEHKTPMVGVRHGKHIVLTPGIYTYLRRVTDSSIHKGGEIVMEDTPQELESHLEFMLKARGRVLVTGLGLGCVIRGALANGKVDSIVCVERSKDVIGLVAPYMDTQRLSIVHADALEWVKNNNLKFDCAYHDLWTDRDNGEPSLQCWHTEMIAGLKNKTTFQGAWSFPREIRRYMIQKLGFSIV